MLMPAMNQNYGLMARPWPVLEKDPHAVVRLKKAVLGHSGN